jgi:hypothetical protein
MTAPIDVVLARLEGVRKAGKGWRADSPVTGSKGAVSICEADNGSILIHDFSAAGVHEVLAAIGLKPGDLFPERERPQSAADRKANRDALAMVGLRSAAEVIGRESKVVLAAVGSLLKGEALPLAEVERLRLAGERIDAVRDALACEVRA